jgi:O-antigen ligase
MLLGTCVIIAAAFGAVVKDVASGVFLVFIVTSLFYIRQWPQTWKSLDILEKLFLTGLALYMVSGLLSYLNTEDDYEYVKQMGRYARFALIVSVYLFLVHARFDLIRFFVIGVIASGPVYLLFAYISTYDNPGAPGQGYYHHILFGDTAMLNALLMMTFLIVGKFSTWIKLLILVSMICAFYAAILSTARGAWLAAPVVIVMLLWYVNRKRYIETWKLGIILAVVVSVVIISPAKEVISNRYEEAINEIQLFKTGEKIDTSVGMRFAMWHIAIDVWKNNPVLGTGAGDYDDDLIARKQQGMYVTIHDHKTVHNIYLQVLASNGILGVLVFLPALIIFPLIYIGGINSGDKRLEKLASLVLVVSAAIFGLTESWILRAPFIAIYAIYFVVLVTSLTSNKQLRSNAK